MDGAGVSRVCGGADLKASQYYPKLFGKAVAQLYAKYEAENIAEVKKRMHLGLHSIFAEPRLAIGTSGYTV